MSQTGTRAVRDNNYPKKLEKGLIAISRAQPRKSVQPHSKISKTRTPSHPRTHTHTALARTLTHLPTNTSSQPLANARTHTYALIHNHGHDLESPARRSRPRRCASRDGARPDRPVCARAPTHLPPAPLHGAGVCKSVLWPLNHTHMYAVLHSRAWLGCSVAQTLAQSVTLAHRVHD
jgi:hypothetical protein